MRIVENTRPIIEKMSLFDKKTGQNIPFALWPRQVEFLDEIHTHRKVAYLKKRQVAGSSLTGADSICQCGLIPEFLVLALSKTGEDSAEYLKRISDMYHSLPPVLKAAWPLAKETADRMVFKNGSRIMSLSAQRGAGFTANRIIIDEAAFIKSKTAHIDLETVIKNVEPALDKAEGQLILVTTADGYDDFYDIYKLGEDPESSWESFFFSCWDDPTFSEEKREQIVKDHGSDHANCNYPRTAEEAFLKSGRCFFSSDILHEMIAGMARPGRNGRLIEIHKNVSFQEDPDGLLTIWDNPRPSVDYIAGVDVAEGIEVRPTERERDFSTIVVFDKKSMHQVAEYECRYEPEFFGEEVNKVCRYFNNAFVGVENNNHGLTTIRKLQSVYGEAHMFYMDQVDEERQVRSKKWGWSSNKKWKPPMLDELDHWFRNSLIEVYSEKTLKQCVTYIENADGSTGAQSKCFDDLVMALGICLQMRRYSPANIMEDVDIGDYYVEYNELMRAG